MRAPKLKGRTLLLEEMPVPHIRAPVTLAPLIVNEGPSVAGEAILVPDTEKPFCVATIATTSVPPEDVFRVPL